VCGGHDRGSHHLGLECRRGCLSHSHASTAVRQYTFAGLLGSGLDVGKQLLGTMCFWKGVCRQIETERTASSIQSPIPIQGKPYAALAAILINFCSTD